MRIKLPAMEVSLSLTVCFVAVSTSTLLALWFLSLFGHKRNSKPKEHHRLPPGPWTLPIIGSLHHVASSLPHRTMMQLSRRHGVVMFLRLGEVPTVVVSSAEVAALVMKTNDLAFASRPHSVTQDIFGCGGKGIAFAPYGDHWRQMRKICAIELLSSRQVKRMEGIRVEEVGNLLRSITASGGATVNLNQMVKALGNDIVSRGIFGSKFRHQEEYLRELDKAFTLLGGFCLVDLFPSSRLLRWLSIGERQLKRSHGRIHRLIANVIEERKATRAGRSSSSSDDDDDDLLDVLLKLQQEDSMEFPLTTESIGAVLFDMSSGATETTGNVLAWTMSELVRNPKIMAKAQQEVREVLGKGRDVITDRDLTKLHYIKMVIKEALRLHPPAALLPRTAREDCTITGYDIPKGTNVYINVFAISQDPRYWNDPEEFKPERFQNNNVNYNGTYFEFIPFGAGRRQCPAIQFSSPLLEMTLTNFLYHFNWKLADGASMVPLDMSEKFGLAIRRRYDLQLIAIPHM